MNDNNPRMPARRKMEHAVALLFVALLSLGVLLLLDGCARLHPVLGAYLDPPPDFTDALSHYWALCGLIYLLLLAMSFGASPVVLLFRLFMVLHQKLGGMPLRTKVLMAALGGTILTGYAIFQPPWQSPPAPLTAIHADMLMDNGGTFDGGGPSDAPQDGGPPPPPEPSDAGV